MEHSKENVVFSMENYALKSHVERLENKIKTIQDILIKSGVLIPGELTEAGSAYVVNDNLYVVQEL